MNENIFSISRCSRIELVKWLIVFLSLIDELYMSTLFERQNPSIEIWQVTISRDIPIYSTTSVDIILIYYNIPCSHNRSGADVVTGVLKQGYDPSRQCRGSQEQGRVAVVEEVVLEVTEVSDVEVKIIDVELASQEL
jgi:hypothetical protein